MQQYCRIRRGELKTSGNLSQTLQKGLTLGIRLTSITMQMNTEVLTIRISEDLVMAIQFAAEQRGIKRTDAIKNALANEFSPFIKTAKKAAKSTDIAVTQLEAA